MYKVLICDDETDIRNALNIYLTAQGYETLLCANGQEALEALSRENIALVLLDIMPDAEQTAAFNARLA